MEVPPTHHVLSLPSMKEEKQEEKCGERHGLRSEAWGQDDEYPGHNREVHVSPRSEGRAWTPWDCPQWGVRRSVGKGSPGRIIPVSRQLPGLRCSFWPGSLPPLCQSLSLGKLGPGPVLSAQWSDDGPGGSRAALPFSCLWVWMTLLPQGLHKYHCNFCKANRALSKSWELLTLSRSSL